mmetsp:Transcript_26300/g.61349  ORF Transcript_26300/g.61349 Transcript_26300/m.61349 type:complete len:312 (-) Transcript_26300:42-977(-)|eukprot:CAMPEP_0171104534 /NCGR_PEP_ID=MMETSP0766_2-20121228/60842_1 /TAXON_ID=439317 /ORGANISM="Gambierdiscus australes, Strain CAWD 149" /LENGTH=311 /DNA_ID=CAMNT_0011565177 /DNA_START=56 /DNA_END=991 /DNA_ORIENTATION=-
MPLSKAFLLWGLLVSPTVRGLVSRRDMFGLLSQPAGLPSVVPNRYYLFLTHHKTGTNLLQQVCNRTALAISEGTAQCAFCPTLLPPASPGAPLRCAGDSHPAHGGLRGTFSRFTLVSNLKGQELRLVQRFTPDYRAVHMIREPETMALSEYQYEIFLRSSVGAVYQWDEHTTENVSNMEVHDALRVVAKTMRPFVKDMLSTHQVAQNDSAVMTTDLENFSHDFNGTLVKVFNFLFDNLPKEQLDKLVRASQPADKTKWPLKRKQREAAYAGHNLSNRTMAERAWRDLEKQGELNVVKIMAAAEPLGYRLLG